MRWRTIVTLLLGLSLLPTPAQAQRRKACPPPTKQKSSGRPALAVINNPATTYQSGEVSVAVRGDENPIVRLQMVASGQALVEFPAKDGIFKVNPADPDLVTIEDSPTKESDHYILLRSSKQFLPSAPGAQSTTAATSMLVQMTSGMVITLLIYPVRDLAQVVHRCVVRYDREAIVGARRAAGLTVNLDRREDSLAPKPAFTSFQFAPPLKLNLPVPLPQSALVAGLSGIPPAADARASEVRAKQPPTSSPQVHATEVKNRKENRAPAGQWEGWNGKLKWSQPLHGLKTAAQTRALTNNEREVLVTLRNTLSAPVGIVPEHPELTVQTLDERGRVLQVEPVKALKVEMEKPDGLLAPSETRRYLISYEAPILGAKQRLCVSVAQINAADEPVIVELTTGTR